MSTAQDVVNVLLGSTVVAGAVREVWLYLKTRDTAKREAEAKRVETEAKQGDDAAKRADAATNKLVAFAERQHEASEQRAKDAAERAVTIATALNASATAQTETARALDRVSEALRSSDARAEDRHRDLLEALERTHRQSAPPTGEHRVGGDPS